MHLPVVAPAHHQPPPLLHPALTPDPTPPPTPVQSCAACLWAASAALAGSWGRSCWRRWGAPPLDRCAGAGCVGIGGGGVGRWGAEPPPARCDASLLGDVEGWQRSHLPKQNTRGTPSLRRSRTCLRPPWSATSGPSGRRRSPRRWVQAGGSEPHFVCLPARPPARPPAACQPASLPARQLAAPSSVWCQSRPACTASTSVGRQAGSRAQPSGRQAGGCPGRAHLRLSTRDCALHPAQQLCADSLLHPAAAAGRVGVQVRGMSWDPVVEKEKAKSMLAAKSFNSTSGDGVRVGGGGDAPAKSSASLLPGAAGLAAHPVPRCAPPPPTGHRGIGATSAPPTAPRTPAHSPPLRLPPCCRPGCPPGLAPHPGHRAGGAHGRRCHRESPPPTQPGADLQVKSRGPADSSWPADPFICAFLLTLGLPIAPGLPLAASCRGDGSSSEHSKSCAMPRFGPEGPVAEPLAAAAFALLRGRCLPGVLPCSRLAIAAVDFADLPVAGAAAITRFLVPKQGTGAGIGGGCAEVVAGAAAGGCSAEREGLAMQQGQGQQQGQQRGVAPCIGRLFGRAHKRQRLGSAEPQRAGAASPALPASPASPALPALKRGITLLAEGAQPTAAPAPAPPAAVAPPPPAPAPPAARPPPKAPTAQGASSAQRHRQPAPPVAAAATVGPVRPPQAARGLGAAPGEDPGQGARGDVPQWAPAPAGHPPQRGREEGEGALEFEAEACLLAGVDVAQQRRILRDIELRQLLGRQRPQASPPAGAAAAGAGHGSRSRRGGGTAGAPSGVRGSQPGIAAFFAKK